jgi:hypothetical protein
VEEEEEEEWDEDEEEEEFDLESSSSLLRALPALPPPSLGWPGTKGCDEFALGFLENWQTKANLEAAPSSQGRACQKWGLLESCTTHSLPPPPAPCPSINLEYSSWWSLRSSNSPSPGRALHSHESPFQRRPIQTCRGVVINHSSLAGGRCTASPCLTFQGRGARNRTATLHCYPSLLTSSS